MPEPNQIQAQCGVTIEPIPELDKGHSEWFLEEFEIFTRRQELERAILKSADLLEKGDYDPVEKLIKENNNVIRDKEVELFSNIFRSSIDKEPILFNLFCSWIIPYNVWYNS